MRTKFTTTLIIFLSLFYFLPAQDCGISNIRNYSTCPELPQPAKWYCSEYIYNHHVREELYSIGGMIGSTITDSVFMLELNGCYNYPNSTQWVRKANMPTKRMLAGSAMANNGKIYVFGGWDGVKDLDVVEEYDPTTNTWSTKAPMPFPRSKMIVTKGDSNKIYLIGGTHKDSLFSLSDVISYDPINNSWQSHGSYPANLGISEGKAVFIPGSIYVPGSNVINVYGGAPFWNIIPANYPLNMIRVGLYPGVKIYDPILNSWTTGQTGTWPALNMSASYDSLFNFVLISGGGTANQVPKNRYLYIHMESPGTPFWDTLGCDTFPNFPFYYHHNQWTKMGHDNYLSTEYIFYGGYNDPNNVWHNVVVSGAGPSMLPETELQLTVKSIHKSIILNCEGQLRERGALELQKFIDGNWTTISSSESFGSDPFQYAFQDHHPTNGSNRYRVQGRNLDSGQLFYSEVREVNWKIEYRFNPVIHYDRTSQKVSATLQEGKIHVIKISDMEGRVLIESRDLKSPQSIVLDAGPLANGVYIISVTTDQGSFNSKLLLQ